MSCGVCTLQQSWEQCQLDFDLLTFPNFQTCKTALKTEYVLNFLNMLSPSNTLMKCFLCKHHLRFDFRSVAMYWSAAAKAMKSSVAL